MATKMVEEISRSPSMRSEQGSGWLSDWGGPSQYVAMGKAPMEARLVYYALQEGATDEASIGIHSGLSVGDVSRGLSYLRGKGWVKES